jgi:hypothetical protein
MRPLPCQPPPKVLPLFRVTMVLERNSRVELRPTIQQLFDTVHKVCCPCGQQSRRDARCEALGGRGPVRAPCYCVPCQQLHVHSCLLPPPPRNASAMPPLP